MYLEIFPYIYCLVSALSSATSSAWSLEQQPVSHIIKAWNAPGWLNVGLFLLVVAFQTVSPTSQPALTSSAEGLCEAGSAVKMNFESFWIELTCEAIWDFSF